MAGETPHYHLCFSVSAVPPLSRSKTPALYLPSHTDNIRTLFQYWSPMNCVICETSNIC
jgi:hypothetical protein